MPFYNDILKCIFVNKYILISINISMKFVPNGPINTIPALVHVMAWGRPGDKSLYEPMMFSLLMQNDTTQPQWVYKFLWLTFSQIVTINTTYVTPMGKVYCIFLEFILSFKLYIHLNAAMCNNGSNCCRTGADLYCLDNINILNQAFEFLKSKLFTRVTDPS